MTDDHLAFRRAICEKPDDDAPRLIYADWIQEFPQQWVAGRWIDRPELNAQSMADCYAGYIRREIGKSNQTYSKVTSPAAARTMNALIDEFIKDSANAQAERLSAQLTAIDPVTNLWPQKFSDFTYGSWTGWSIQIGEKDRYGQPGGELTSYGIRALFSRGMLHELVVPSFMSGGRFYPEFWDQFHRLLEEAASMYPLMSWRFEGTTAKMWDRRIDPIPTRRAGR